MAKSNYLISQTLAYTQGAYIALYPGDPATTPELSEPGYGRKAASFSIAGDTATLDADLVYGPAGTDWGTITHVALFDAATGGNMLWTAPLDAPKAIDIGDEAKLPAGTGLTITEE